MKVNGFKVNIMVMENYSTRNLKIFIKESLNMGNLMVTEY